MDGDTGTLAAVKAGAPAWVTLVDGADHCTVTHGLGIVLSVAGWVERGQAEAKR